MNAPEEAIIRTLVYSDIFDYPLTKHEIWQYLPQADDCSYPKFRQSLKKLVIEKKVSLHEKWYYLTGRKQIADKRKKRAEESRKKEAQAIKIASFLMVIPTVSLIGVSGGLAVNNADKDDDIDFFIVTRPHAMWITRLVVLCALQLLGKRRKRTDTTVKDKICLNSIVDETALKIPEQHHNLYTAREIVQLKPLVFRKDMYKQFLNANSWISTFLPHYKNVITERLQHGRTYPESFDMAVWFFQFLDTIAKYIQLWYINRHRTNEYVSDHAMAFYPYNYAGLIITRYKRGLRQYEKI